jgi:hypothetical protein
MHWDGGSIIFVSHDHTWTSFCVGVLRYIMISTPSIPINKASFLKIQVNFGQTFREKTINNYNVILLSYENIFHDVSNSINFIMYSLRFKI